MWLAVGMGASVLSDATANGTTDPAMAAPNRAITPTARVAAPSLARKVLVMGVLFSNHRRGVLVYRVKVQCGFSWGGTRKVCTIVTLTGRTSTSRAEKSSLTPKSRRSAAY